MFSRNKQPAIKSLIAQGLGIAALHGSKDCIHIRDACSS